MRNSILNEEIKWQWPTCGFVFSLEYGSLGSYAEIIDQGCVTATYGLNEFA